MGCYQIFHLCIFILDGSWLYHLSKKIPRVFLDTFCWGLFIWESFLSFSSSALYLTFLVFFFVGCYQIFIFVSLYWIAHMIISFVQKNSKSFSWCFLLGLFIWESFLSILFQCFLVSTQELFRVFYGEIFRWRACYANTSNFLILQKESEWWQIFWFDFSSDYFYRVSINFIFDLLIFGIHLGFALVNLPFRSLNYVSIFSWVLPLTIL